MPTMPLDAIRNTLFWAFSDTVLWWEQQAIEDPADKRNTNAASLLHKLSSSAFDVEDATLIAHLELRERDDDEYEFYELLNTVGFEWFPQSADAFLRRFISKRAGTAGATLCSPGRSRAPSRSRNSAGADLSASRISSFRALWPIFNGYLMQPMRSGRPLASFSFHRRSDSA
jgi:hypothetical protein